MILVVEPVFPNAHHSPTNSGVLQAIGLAAGDEAVVFAAHPAHRNAVFDILGEEQCGNITYRDIKVIPAGGVSFRRFWSQTSTLLQLVRALRPRLVVFLGTQPETLFVCRLLTIVHPRIAVIAVLHGNLNQAAVGWRSRDPRRRLFDDRSSLRVAMTSPRIQFVLLDKSVRDAAVSLGVVPAARTHVWPHTIPDREVCLWPHRPDPSRIRIAFLGSAKWAKGFGDFAGLARRLAARSGRYEFSLIGGLQDEFPAESLAHILIPQGFLNRDDFLKRLHNVDYVCLPLRDDTYTLTVSGAIIDAVAALKPLIALPTPAIRDLFAGGPIGFLCEDLPSMQTVMENVETLANPLLYATFRSNLEREQRSRSPRSLAKVLGPMIAQPNI